ncbi:M48 family metallopeptidase [Rossellomorea vietnamensis]|uniref:M48 family metallopeptidase n=1 Tax=Rossellomorea vietnamensis TaxID=218284 RepID=A0A5D4NSI4_9BACI|nr:SprT family zinc-dependent metalloprotease [Rossellomorea vietnamensis]TYS16571.1 M48 family metallopeptidase [Rossellomorea vietnamensis]
MNHTFSGQTIHFNIKYKNRKSIGIYLDSYGNIEVHAPKGTPDEAILRLIEDRWEVILQNSKERKDRLNGPQEKDYVHGEQFLYLGKVYPIEVHEDWSTSQDHIKFDENTLHIYVKQLEGERIKQALKRFYYRQCKALVEKSISEHQHHFKTKPHSIRITDSKTTWGTCDGKRQLTFNWKLAMAPREVIDYVVVHEMCHMIHLNHDRSFWRLVGKIVPDYKEKENWLAASNWKMTV